MRFATLARSLRWVRAQDALIVLGLALYWLSLTIFPQVWNRWPLRSHYYLQNKCLLWPLAWSAVPLLLTVAGLLVLTWKRRNGTLAILLLFAGAVSLQWSFSLLEGLGAKRLSSTLLSTQYGHSQFVRLAHQEDRPLDLARRYEERCAAADSRSYTQTKPPGHALFYVLAAQLYRTLPVQSTSEWLANRAAFERREPFTAFAAFATILFSLVSCLPVIVLSRLGARLGNGSDAAYYGLAFLLLPAINLVTMHLDQVLYPLCAALVLLSAVLALQKHAAFGALTALCLYASLYVSFSLLFLLPTVGLWWAAHFLLRPELRARVLRATASLLIGMLLCYAAFRWALGFEMLRAYHRAMEHHAAWRDTAGLVGLRGTIRNLVEAALWFGIPATVLCGAQWLRSVRRLFRRSLDPVALFFLLYPLIVLAVSTCGQTTREIGRLWIPLFVPACLAVATEMGLLYKRRPTVFVLLSSLAILLRKNYHDFC